MEVINFDMSGHIGVREDFFDSLVIVIRADPRNSESEWVYIDCGTEVAPTRGF